MYLETCQSLIAAGLILTIKLTVSSVQSQVIKPDVVLTSMEALAGDAAELQQVSWDLIIVDERSRARSSVAKAHSALKDFPATSFRLQLSHGLPPQVCCTMRLESTTKKLIKRF